jgi:two-component system, response regulator PdtaR
MNHAKRNPGIPKRPNPQKNAKVVLGEASGIAAVKEILRSGFVPYVFVTGSALSGLSLGPDTVLIRKPFRVSDLDQAIQRALSAASACDRVAE